MSYPSTANTVGTRLLYDLFGRVVLSAIPTTACIRYNTAVPDEVTIFAGKSLSIEQFNNFLITFLCGMLGRTLPVLYSYFSLLKFTPVSYFQVIDTGSLAAYF